MDRREAILVRLLEILQGLGVATVARNVVALDDLDLPAIVLLDGDEQAFEADIPTAGQPNTRFTRMTMLPEIVIKVGLNPESCGTALNAARAMILKAVKTDATLAGLHTPAGHVHPMGASTALGYGRTGLGECALIVAVTYPLRPDEL
ncbi:MAG: hypothetical protein U1E62_05445 [Alsobacter sp.]